KPQIISFAVATDAGNRRGGEQLSPTGRDDQRLPADGQLSLAGGPSAVDGEIDAGRLAANSAMTRARAYVECVEQPPGLDLSDYLRRERCGPHRPPCLRR